MARSQKLLEVLQAELAFLDEGITALIPGGRISVEAERGAVPLPLYLFDSAR